MLIFKIFRPSEWQTLHEQGATVGAPIDISDGYVHFSTSAQVAETTEKHFAEDGDLWLLALEAGGLGEDLKWEPSRGGQLFPHLYGSLRMADVTWAKSLPLIEGVHQFPGDMA